MESQKQGATGTLPKNIRQIGNHTGNTKIYLEDYVYTYLHTQEEQEDWVHKGFILLGRIERDESGARFFASGLIQVQDKFFEDNILKFDDGTWAYIYQEMKKYYDNLEIIGWGQDISGASASMTAELERYHKQNFNIQKNVLFLMDQVENDEAFFVFEKNMLQRKEGYYVYYEKNPQMQEYMIETRKSQELDIPPDVINEAPVHSYREALLEKKGQASARKWNGMLYATSMMLVLSVCVLGVSTVNNVEKMQNLESTVSQLSGQMNAQSKDAGLSPAMSSQVQQTAKDDAGAQDNAGEDGGKTDSKAAANDEDKQAPDASDAGAEQDSTAGSGDKQDSSWNAGLQKDTDQFVDTELGNRADSSTGQQGDAAGSEPADSKKKDKSTASDAETAFSDNLKTDVLTEAQTYLLQGYYIVKKGDNLAKISKKIYGTSKKAKSICELNGIDDMDKIYVGQKLELP